MPLAAGKLRHRVTLQRRLITRGPAGEQIETWATVPGLETVPANVTPLGTRARDLVAAGAMQSEVKAVIQIRYREDITADMRALHGNRTYYLAGEPFQDNESGRQWLSLPCKDGIIER